MARAEVKINRGGVKELLRDPGVADYLDQLAQRVASAAGPDVVIVNDLSGGYRAVAQVHDVQPGAIEREAASGRLAHALDAAR